MRKWKFGGNRGKLLLKEQRTVSNFTTDSNHRFDRIFSISVGLCQTLFSPIPSQVMELCDRNTATVAEFHNLDWYGGE